MGGHCFWPVEQPPLQGLGSLAGLKPRKPGRTPPLVHTHVHLSLHACLLHMPRALACTHVPPTSMGSALPPPPEQTGERTGLPTLPSHRRPPGRRDHCGLPLKPPPPIASLAPYPAPGCTVWSCLWPLHRARAVPCPGWTLDGHCLTLVGPVSLVETPSSPPLGPPCTACPLQACQGLWTLLIPPPCLSQRHPLPAVLPCSPDP